MGMAASQVRLLQLTSRKNTIGRTLEDLSLQKTSLSRDMKRVSKNFQDALSTKTLKWSNNSGVTYVDLSYGNLMRPNTYNNNTPYLLTNTNGNIVLDSKYEKYAEMLEANGGKYEGDTRIAILSGLTGVSKETLSNAATTSAAVESSVENANKLQAELEKLGDSEPTVKKNTEKQFASLVGSVSYNGGSLDIGKLCSQANGSITLGNSNTASSNLSTLLNSIYDNASRYLTEDDKTKFKAACDNYQEQQGETSFTLTKEQLTGGNGFTKDGDNYKVNVATMINQILGAYCNAGGSTTEVNNEIRYVTRDTQSTEWQNWKTSYDAKEAEYKKAQADYKSAVNVDNQSLTASQESEIKFYDQLFAAMVENGYEVNSSVEDNDYLNQMLQNNQFYITTMKETEDDNGKTKYEYDSSIASNIDNIFTVNDADAQNEAQVQYEYEKSVINEKESRIDQRMQNLETEQSAINEMIKGIESVRDKNIETNFAIFG